MRWIYLWATRAPSSKQTNKNIVLVVVALDVRRNGSAHDGIVLMLWRKRFSGMSSAASTWCAITWKKHRDDAIKFEK